MRTLHVRVIALDASTTKAGVTYPDGTSDTLKPPKAAKAGERLLWWQETYRTMFADHRPTRVVVEAGFALHAKTTRTLSQAEGVLLAEVARVGAVLTFVRPTELKKAATGSGTASKEQMMARARELGGDVDNDDEADSYLLWYGAREGWWG